MERALSPVYEIFKLNSRLYLNCLADMDEDQARWRPTDATNSAAFVALHLLDSRYAIARLIGLERISPFAAMTEGKRSINEMEAMPSLAEMKEAWKAVTGEMRERMKELTTDDLNRDTGTKAPIEDRTLLSVLAFYFQHDSFHLGQLALLRKQMGLQPMSYR